MTGQDRVHETMLPLKNCLLDRGALHSCNELSRSKLRGIEATHFGWNCRVGGGAEAPIPTVRNDGYRGLYPSPVDVDSTHILRRTQPPTSCDGFNPSDWKHDSFVYKASPDPSSATRSTPITRY